MSETEVDELFGDGGRQARPKTTRIIAVLTTGVIVSLVVMAEAVPTL